MIPSDELWLKLGGDKGHGSFKLSLQLCNVEHPNSQKNSCLLSMCMAGDSTTNLHTSLDMYKDQISEIEGMDLRYTYDYLVQLWLTSKMCILYSVALESSSSWLEIMNFYAECMGCLELVVRTIHKQ